MKRKSRIIIGCLLGLLISSALAASVTVKMFRTSKDGKSGAFLGVVTFKDTQYGLLIKPNLQNLSPGLHGFHVHAKPSCKDMGLAAGGHFDPAHTDKHLGPYSSNGHLGDLPALYVNSKGMATLPILAPRLKVSELKDHAIMIQAGGDNYSDVPKKLGGGGARIACGIPG